MYVIIDCYINKKSVGHYIYMITMNVIYISNDNLLHKSYCSIINKVLISLHQLDTMLVISDQHDLMIVIGAQHKITLVIGD